MTDLFGESGAPAAVKAPQDWTRGYALDHLKALCAPFRAAAPYVYGAFGYAKERDIALALAKGAFFADDRTQPSVAAIARTLKTVSRRRDFRGESIQIQSGDTVVWDLGMTAEARPTSLQMVLDAAWRTHSSAQWVEWFEEDGRRWMLDNLGFRHVGTRIAAGSEIKGLYVRWRSGAEPRLPLPMGAADGIAVACLQERFITEDERVAILAELANATWNQHYSSYNRRKSWTAFALRGYAPLDPGFIVKPSEMSEAWKRENAGRYHAAPDWTTIRWAFPATNAVIRRAHAGPLDRVRFMRLAAESGELSRHADITDHDAGTADGRVARLHIPIETQPSCLVSSWGIRGQQYERHFPVRSLCYLDQRRPHAVRNPGHFDRIHLVIDAYANDDLRRRFELAAWRCDD